MNDEMTGVFSFLCLPIAICMYIHTSLSDHQILQITIVIMTTQVIQTHDMLGILITNQIASLSISYTKNV